MVKKGTSIRSTKFVTEPSNVLDRIGLLGFLLEKHLPIGKPCTFVLLSFRDTYFDTVNTYPSVCHFVFSLESSFIYVNVYLFISQPSTPPLFTCPTSMRTKNTLFYLVKQLPNRHPYSLSLHNSHKEPKDRLHHPTPPFSMMDHG